QLLGLSSWKVDRVYYRQHHLPSADSRLSLSQIAPRLDSTLNDYSRVPRLLVGQKLPSKESEYGFQLATSTRRPTQRLSHLFQGLALNTDSQARRKLSVIPQGQLEKIQRQTEQKRLLKNLLFSSDQRSPTLSSLNQVDTLTEGIPALKIPDTLYQLGSELSGNGHHEMAIQIYLHLLEKYPSSPLTPILSKELLRFYNSEELTWQLSRKNESTSLSIGEEQGASSLSEKPTDLNGYALLKKNRRQLTTGAAEHFSQWAGPYANEPAQRLLQANVYKKLGNQKKAEDLYRQLQQQTSSPLLKKVALAERWNFHRNGTPPKAHYFPTSTITKPFLDGKFDDPLWKTTTPLTLSPLADMASSQGAPPLANNQVRIAFDDSFLYLAIQCKKKATYQYNMNKRERTRDEDLSSYDRIQIHLDIDNDYSTGYRLEIDHRGHTHDQCIESPASWNPQWFVANDEDEQYWYLEIAIAHEEFSPSNDLRGEVWNCTLIRRTPGSPSQTWPAGSFPSAPLLGSGYLLFH
ncbi:MAG: hypothetical protein MPJ24_06110, partial [Pirellulaceae bacterium]|nr:hypothetical protein [Pirellulaceae bacterium]